MSDLAVSTLSSILIAVVTAWVAVRLGARRFYAERWWERKAETYTDLMGALYRMEKTYLSYLDAFEKQRRVLLYQNPSEKSPEQIDHDDALDAVTREVAMGEFVISAEASAILDGLLKDLRRSVSENDNPYQLYDARVDLLRKRATELRAAAKRDLKIGRRRGGR